MAWVAYAAYMVQIAPMWWYDWSMPTFLPFKRRMAVSTISCDQMRRSVGVSSRRDLPIHSRKTC